MQQKLTLSEIAAIYQVTPKTFRKQVKEKNIPHEVIGREMRFVLSRVEACLAAAPEIPTPKKTYRYSRPSKSKSLLAERLGI